MRERDGGRCFTCGKVDDPKRMQCGHYASRTHRSLRWDERNCNCQCVACNVFMHGNMDSYALALIRKHGRGILEELDAEKRKVRKWTVPELEAMIARYSKLNAN